MKKSRSCESDKVVTVVTRDQELGVVLESWEHWGLGAEKNEDPGNHTKVYFK